MIEAIKAATKPKARKAPAKAVAKAKAGKATLKALKAAAKPKAAKASAKVKVAKPRSTAKAAKRSVNSAVKAIRTPAKPKASKRLAKAKRNHGKLPVVKLPKKEVPQQAAAFAKGAAEVAAKEVHDFVDRLPRALQKHRKLFFEPEFIERCIEDYVFGISPQLTDLELRTREHGDPITIAVTIPSLWYTAALLSDAHAH